MVSWRFGRDRRMWTLVATGSAALASVVGRQALRQGWRAWRGEQPPENPAAPDVTWRDALLWSAATGLVIGLGRVLAARGAAAGWRRLTGRWPPL